MITIIGAGPAGCTAAYELTKAGKEVQLFEEHPKIGLPVQCTGVLTKTAKEVLEIKEDFLTNTIKKIKVFAPNGNFLEVNLKEEEFLIDRDRLDPYLAKQAEKAGAVIYTSHKFLGKEDGKLLIKDNTTGKTKKVETDILIGADGPLSAVAKSENIFGEREFYIGVQARIKMKIELHTYETYLGSNFPEFFGWIVPENNGIVRIGLGAKKDANAYFNKFMEMKGLKKQDVVDYQGGLIPIYKPGIITQKNNTYLVGDAATHIKSTTGGGLVQGMTAAKILAGCIINNKDYTKEWRKKICRELWLHYRLRKTLDKFRDKDYDKLIGLTNKRRIINVLESYSRDKPSSLLLQLLLKEPRYLGFAVTLLR